MQFFSERNKEFKLTWKIHNITMIPYKAGVPLWSPTIVVDIFDNTEWNFGLYVRGQKNENYVTCLVYRGKSENGDDTIPVNLEIFLKKADGSSTLICEKDYEFARNNGHGFQLIPHKEIFQNKKYLFPGDILIIEYRLTKNNVEQQPTLQSRIRNYAFDSQAATKTPLDALKKALQPEISHCRIRSHINLEELRFIWAIPKFFTIKEDQKLSVNVHFASKHSPKFVLSITPNKTSRKPDDSMLIVISAENKEPFFCSYEILLIDCDRVSRIHMKGEHLFEPGISMSRIVPNSLKWSELQQNKHLHLVDETLTLYYKFLVTSASSVKSVIEQTTYFAPKYGVYSLKSLSDEDKTISDQIKKHNTDRKFSDVSLQVEGKLLRTHKIILCTWSSVFKTILEQDLYEDCNILDINDISAETIDRMLVFMYSQTVEDLNWVEAAKLYLAADKYNIIQLLENCSRIMESKISITNVSELLFLADSHENKELKRFATNFIKEHKDEVLRTEEWKKLMTSKGALAAKLMHEMFVED